MAKILIVNDVQGNPSHWWFYCPGCKEGHGYTMDGRWQFNGDLDKPTFAPSLLHPKKYHRDINCHLFVTDGKIQFCSDCDHELAGKTVEMEDIRDLGCS